MRGRCDALMIKNTKTVSETASNNILLARLLFDDRLTTICQLLLRLIYYAHGEK